MSKDKNNQGRTKSILLQLYENKSAYSKVINGMDTGSMTYDELIEFVDEKYGIKLSKSSLSRLSKKRDEAEQTGIPIGELLDQRKKNGNIIDISKNRDNNTSTFESAKQAFNNWDETTTKVYSSIQVLDEMIEKAYKGLQNIDTLEPEFALKAIGVREKLDKGQTGGLSLIGLKELMIRSQAKESALTEVIFKFIPEEQHEEVAQALEDAEEEYYESMDLTEEEKRIENVFKQMGLD